MIYFTFFKHKASEPEARAIVRRQFQPRNTVKKQHLGVMSSRHFLKHLPLKRSSEPERKQECMGAQAAGFVFFPPARALIRRNFKMDSYIAAAEVTPVVAKTDLSLELDELELTLVGGGSGDVVVC